MPARYLPTWKRFAATAAMVLAVQALAAALFVWSGVYPIGANRDHLAITTWLLTVMRERSVDTYSMFVDERRLDDPNLVSLGAAHYEGACVPCHARPGQPIGVIASRMLPPPPHLAKVLVDREDRREIFWIVENGLKYTGMPAWPAEIRDDEVWAVTAFLDRLRAGGTNAMDSYPALAGIDRLRPADGGEQLTAGREPLTQCLRCHDDRGLPTLGTLVPKLAGQSETYLRRALEEYAARARPSGIMQPVAEALSESSIEQLAAYYADLEPAPAAPTEADAGRVARGELLARRGDPEQGIPACLACHGSARGASFPSLAGQHADYLVSQLELWQRGGRSTTTHGQIMAAIAQRLKPEQMRDAAAYFASLRREAPATDATADGRP